MVVLKFLLYFLFLIIRGRGRWKGIFLFKVILAIVVCRFFKEFDFFRFREGFIFLLGEFRRFIKVEVRISGEKYIFEYL